MAVGCIEQPVGTIFPAAFTHSMLHFGNACNILNSFIIIIFVDSTSRMSADAIISYATAILVQVPTTSRFPSVHSPWCCQLSS